MNLYYVGNIRGAYRSSELIKSFLSHTNIHLYINDFVVRNIFEKLANKISDVITLKNADIVYIGPCQHNNALVKPAVKYKKIIITDFYISFYDTEVFDRKNCTINSKMAKKWKQIDLFALNNSNVVLFLNESEAKLYTKRLGVDLEKLNYRIVPLCIPEKPKAKLPYFHHKRDYINFCWCGTYIPLQALNKIIKASAIAVNRGLKMRLTIWGNSDEKFQPYKKMVDEEKMSNYIEVINDQWGNTKSWEKYISENCDVSFGIFGDSEKARTVLANKVVDGVAFRTPVITGDSLGLREFFTEDSIFICKNTPENIADKMIEISKMSLDEINTYINRAYDVYIDNFTPKCFNKKIDNILKEELK